MASGRTIAVATGLLVALAATGVLVVFVLGDRSRDAEAPEPEVVELLPRAAVSDEAPSLEGRADARPLRMASLAALLAALLDEDEKEDEQGEGRDAIYEELRARAQGDPGLIQRLVERLDHVETRGTALRALTALGAPAARPLASWGLRQNDAWCHTALELLRGLGPEAASAVDLLLERLAGEEDAWMWRALFDVLAAVGPAARQAVPLLTELLTPPLDDTVVRDAAVALAAIDGDNPATAEVYRAALLDEETLARPGVLEAVGRLGPAAAPLVPLVIELLVDPEDATRIQAAASLGALGITSRAVLDALASMLEHDHQHGQRAAAAALVALGPAGGRTLARVAGRVEDVDVRLNAAQVLMGAEGHGEACAEVLLSVLQEECDRGWKQRALVFFARLDPPPRAERVLPTLLQALEDPALAQQACHALSNVPGDAARTALVAALGRPDAPELGVSALDALLRSMAEDPERDALLASLLGPETPRPLVWAALQRLPRLAPKGRASVLLPALEPWLKHEDPSLRALAHQGLGRLTGDEGVLVDRLVAGLADGPIVAACASALQFFPEHAARSVPPLVDALLVLPADSPWRFTLQWAPVTLARGWSGARPWIAARRETADEEGRKKLDELLSRMR